MKCENPKHFAAPTSSEDCTDEESVPLSQMRTCACVHVGVCVSQSKESVGNTRRQLLHVSKAHNIKGKEGIRQPLVLRKGTVVRAQVPVFVNL